MNKEELQAAVDAVPYWYHRIELPHGIITPGWAPIDASVYRIPEDLTGKRVLDVGAWDGYWTFEALKRRAKSVTAIDDFSDTCGATVNADRSKAWKTFDLCKTAFGYGVSQCDRCEETVYNVTQLGQEFDTILCFGVLYHLRHPLLALEKLREVCTGTIHIETAILDWCRSAYNPNKGYDGSECLAEFYPHSEFGMNPSNWNVGTLRYWAALVEAAGFKNIERWTLTDSPQTVSACRGFIRASV